MRESTQTYTLDTGSGKIIELPSSYCQTEWKPGDEILYLSGSTKEVQSIRALTAEDKKNSLEQWWLVGKLISKWPCSGTYQFQTTATDRWFVREWSGTDVEKKIREWYMHAEWKLGNNGAIIITNILSKEDLPK
jgi:hypothetical protein